MAIENGRIVVRNLHIADGIPYLLNCSYTMVNSKGIAIVGSRIDYTQPINYWKVDLIKEYREKLNYPAIQPTDDHYGSFCLDSNDNLYFVESGKNTETNQWIAQIVRSPSPYRSFNQLFQDIALSGIVEFNEHWIDCAVNSSGNKLAIVTWRVVSSYTHRVRLYEFDITNKDLNLIKQVDFTPYIPQILTLNASFEDNTSYAHINLITNNYVYRWKFHDSIISLPSYYTGASYDSTMVNFAYSNNSQYVGIGYLTYQSGKTYSHLRLSNNMSQYIVNERTPSYMRGINAYPILNKQGSPYLIVPYYNSNYDKDTFEVYQPKNGGLELIDTVNNGFRDVAIAVQLNLVTFFKSTPNTQNGIFAVGHLIDDSLHLSAFSLKEFPIPPSEISKLTYLGSDILKKKTKLA